MNKNKKVALALAMMMVATVAAPAVTGQLEFPEDPEYTVTVLSGCDVTIGIVNTDFGNILAGNSVELTPTFTLTNSGDWNATVEAKFVTNNGTTWGMQSGGNMIPGTNFGLKAVDLGAPGYTTLADSDTDTPIPPELPSDSIAYNYDAQLTVPASQATGFYNGTIQLTFSNA